MSFLYEGFNKKVLTFRAQNLRKGSAVTLNAIAEATTSPLEENFIGIVDSYRAGLAGVQITGYAEVKYTGAVPSIGYNKLVISTSGAVKLTTDSKARSYWVVKLDIPNNTIGIIL